MRTAEQEVRARREGREEREEREERRAARRGKNEEIDVHTRIGECRMMRLGRGLKKRGSEFHN